MFNGLATSIQAQNASPQLTKTQAIIACNGLGLIIVNPEYSGKTRSGLDGRPNSKSQNLQGKYLGVLMSYRDKDSFTTKQKLIGIGFLVLAAVLASYSKYFRPNLNSNQTQSQGYGRPDGAIISSSWQESDKLMDYINKLRADKGVKPIRWDDRAYSLAVYRAKDMDQNGYPYATNPKTGECAKTLKTKFGFSPEESVYESPMTYYYPDGGRWGRNDPMTMEMVLNQFLNEKNFTTKEWILADYHQAGAVGCSGSACTIIFSNNTRVQGECEKA